MRGVTKIRVVTKTLRSKPVPARKCPVACGGRTVLSIPSLEFFMTSAGKKVYNGDKAKAALMKQLLCANNVARKGIRVNADKIYAINAQRCRQRLKLLAIKRAAQRERTTWMKLKKQRHRLSQSKELVVARHRGTESAGTEAKGCSAVMCFE